MKPSIPQNKKVDAKLLSKPIAPSGLGCIYLGLLNYLPDSDSNDDCLDTPAIGDNQRHIIDTFPLNPWAGSDHNSNFQIVQMLVGAVENMSSPITIVDEIKFPFDIDLIITNMKSLEICNPVQIL